MRERGRCETRERERKNERREIEVCDCDSLESSIRRMGSCRKRKKKKRESNAQIERETWAFFYLWMVGMPDVIHLFKNGRK